MNFQSRFLQSIFLSSRLSRLIAILIIATVVVMGVFFLVFALVVGALMGTVIFGRLWWLTRKLRVRRNGGVIEGSFWVEPKSQRTIVDGKTDKKSLALPD